MMDMRDEVRRQSDRQMAEPRDQALVAEAKADDLADAITEPQLEHDPAHDVVEARRESAASDDPATHGTRIEEDLVAWPRQLERWERRWRAVRIGESRQCVVEQHPVRGADEMHAALAQVAGDRRRQQATAEDVDRNVVGGQRAHGQVSGFPEGTVWGQTQSAPHQRGSNNAGKCAVVARMLQPAQLPCHRRTTMRE